MQVHSLGEYPLDGCLEIKIENMKKLLLTLALAFFTVFSFNSCELLDDLQDQKCAPGLDYQISVTQMRIQIVSTTLASGTVNWTAQKFYCDGEYQWPFEGIIHDSQFNDNQYAQTNVNMSWNLHNEFDYVVITATLVGKTQSQRFDYKDIPAGETKTTIVVEFVFTI